MDCFAVFKVMPVFDPLINYEEGRAGIAVFMSWKPVPCQRLSDLLLIVPKVSDQAWQRTLLLGLHALSIRHH